MLQEVVSTSVCSEYVFIGIIRMSKVADVISLLDVHRDRLSFIVPECNKKDMEQIQEKYGKYVNMTLIIDGITKNQIDTEVDILDKSLNKIKALFLNIKENVAYVKGIISSCEAAVYPAAVLRTLFSIPGLQSEQGILFRDKCKMKDRIVSQNSSRTCVIRTPKYTQLDQMDYDAVLVQAQKHHIQFPMILKPRSQAGSFGVHLVHDSNELKLVLENNLITGYELDEFIDSKIVHSNGFVDQGRIVFAYNFYYNDTPLKFGCTGNFDIAHIEISNVLLNQKIYHFASEIISRLGMQKGIFHLEIFIDSQENLIFLEIAARPPGSFIVPLIEVATGINLQVVHCLIEMNRTNLADYLKLGSLSQKNKYYGAYIAPFKYKHSIKIVKVEVTNLHGVNIEKSIFPKIGSNVAPNAILYNNLGLIIFSGSDSDNLFSQYNILKDCYRVEVEE